MLCDVFEQYWPLVACSFAVLHRCGKVVAKQETFHDLSLDVPRYKLVELALKNDLFPFIVASCMWHQQSLSVLSVLELTWQQAAFRTHWTSSLWRRKLNLHAKNARAKRPRSRIPLCDCLGQCQWWCRPFDFITTKERTFWASLSVSFQGLGIASQEIQLPPCFL